MAATIVQLRSTNTKLLSQQFLCLLSHFQSVALLTRSISTATHLTLQAYNHYQPHLNLPQTTRKPSEQPHTMTATTEATPAIPAQTEPAPVAPTPTAPAPTSTSPITLRQPSTSSTTGGDYVHPPTLSWLQGPWNVTHSTLPMWKKSRNVIIKYTPIPKSGSAGGLGHVAGTHIDDEVTYQAVDKGKSNISTVRGVDKPFPTGEPTQPTSATAPPPATPSGEELASLGYNWRGKGWLMIASSKWEILGYGTEESTGNSWVVTYFAKTLFTPAGVDFYSGKRQLQPATVEGIKEAIKGLGGDVAKLGGEVFEVAYDGEREGMA